MPTWMAGTSPGHDGRGEETSPFLSQDQQDEDGEGRSKPDMPIEGAAVLVVEVAKGRHGLGIDADAAPGRAGDGLHIRQELRQPPGDAGEITNSLGDPRLGPAILTHPVRDKRLGQRPDIEGWVQLAAY